MASEPYVKCESCTLFVPPSDLHPCGPGGRWRYCSRCFAHTETWPETKDTSRTSNLVAAARELLRLKDLKTDANAIETSGSWNAVHQRDAMLAEHNAKAPPAWDALRRALHELPVETTTELRAAWSHWLNSRQQDECDTWHAFQAGWNMRNAGETPDDPYICAWTDTKTGKTGRLCTLCGTELGPESSPKTGAQS